MAYTQPEKEYIQRLFRAQPSLTNDDVRSLIDKRRKKEVTMNTPKQKGILGKIGSGLMNVGAGAIQAGGELAVGLPGQLTRLAPGDQSANPNSLYNKSRKVLDFSKNEMVEAGRNTEGFGFGFGNSVMNIAGGSVGAGLIGKGIQAGAKTSTAVNLGSKIASKSPTVAKYGTSLLEGLTGATTKGNIGQRVLGGITTGAREGLGFDLASGEAPGTGTVAGGVIGGALPAAGALLKGTANVISGVTKPKGLADDIIRNIVQPSKTTASFDNELTDGMKHLLGTKDVSKIKTFKELQNLANDEAKQIYTKFVNPTLKQSKGVIKNPSMKDAIVQLQMALKGQGGSAVREQTKELKDIIRFYVKNKGLTAELANRLKILHTKNNALFTARGLEAGGISADNLRVIRQDIKNAIETHIKKQGLGDISVPNKAYGALVTLAQQLDDQARSAIAYAGRETTPGVVGRAAEKLLDTKPAKMAMGAADVILKKSPLKTLRSGKINPYTVQKELQDLLKRAKAALMNETAVTGSTGAAQKSGILGKSTKGLLQRGAQIFGNGNDG